MELKLHSTIFLHVLSVFVAVRLFPYEMAGQWDGADKDLHLLVYDAASIGKYLATDIRRRLEYSA